MRRDPVAGDPYDAGHGTTDLHVEHYDLDLTYRVVPNRLSGTATLTVRALADVRDLALDLGALRVEQVRVTGAGLTRYQHRAGRLTLRLDAVVPAGSRVVVAVRYSGTPVPAPSPWGTVGWEELTDGVLVAGQPTGAPSWFPCNDRPGDKATFRTSLTVDSPYAVVATGALVDRRARAATTTWVYEQPCPTAPYLATVQVGRYVPVELAAGPVRQTALVPEELRSTARRSLAAHPQIMSLFTQVFGPYPFDAYTLVVTADELEIPLEAQGMGIFGRNHLAAGRGPHRLVAHELAHQWFGNSVGVATWRDIWLNEGFACYAEWLWSPHAGGPSTDALARQHRARLAALPQDLVLSDPGLPRIFDDRVYERGALTLHALRLTVGEAAFAGLLAGWAARHAHGVATTDDLRAHVAGHVAAVLGPAGAEQALAVLARWLDQAELPELPDPSELAGPVPAR